jgi:polyribonucleotide nucleotidyltransferase
MLGIGTFQNHPKQAALNNSYLLLQYMIDYYNNFFPGLSSILDEGCDERLINIKEISEFVDAATKKDQEYSQIQKIKKDYPQGTQVCAQVVSIKSYGIFIEFDIAGKGLIHESQCMISGCSYMGHFEDGNWLIAEIIEYNYKHNRFSCKLIDVD